MDTHGWDLVTACSQDKLNALLATRLQKTPPTVTYSDGSGLQIAATFDPWKISSFGSDNRLTMILPIRTGSLTSSSKFAAVPQVTLDGAQIEIALDLTFVQDATGKKTDLTFNFQTPATSLSDTTAGAIWVVNADLSGVLAKADPSGAAGQALHDHLPACLIANRDGLAYAISSVNMAPVGTSWPGPVAMEYLFVQGAKTASGGQGPGYLAVLSMVRSLDPKTRSRNIDSTLCDGNHDVCLLLHKDLFLEHHILPMLPSGFVGAQPWQFVVAGDMVMSIAPLICPTVTNAGTDYIPVLSSLQVAVAGDQIQADAVGLFSITGLVNSYVTFDIQQGLKCAFDAGSGGLSLTPAGPPASTYEKHIPTWIYVVGAVALLPLGLILGLVLVAVVDIVVDTVSSAVAGKVGAQGSTTAVGDWAFASVEWPGSTGWSVTEGGLSDSLYLRGSLN